MTNNNVQGVDDFFLQVITIPLSKEQFSKFNRKFSDVEIIEKFEIVDNARRIN